MLVAYKFLIPITDLNWQVVEAYLHADHSAGSLWKLASTKFRRDLLIGYEYIWKVIGVGTLGCFRCQSGLKRRREIVD